MVGEFNNWDGRALLMHKMPMSGIFELFVPGVKAGDAYRYEIKAKGDVLLQKADPYGCLLYTSTLVGTKEMGDLIAKEI